MFVVGWNREQNQAFTVETLEEHIRFNLDAFEDNTNAGIVMLGLFATHKEATAFCESLKPVRDVRLS